MAHAHPRTTAWMLWAALAAGGVLAVERPRPGGSPGPLALMPVPAEVVRGDGRLALDGRFRIVLAGHTEPRLERAAGRLRERLQLRTGIPPVPPDATGAGAPATLEIRCGGPGEAVQSPLEDESYALEVRPDRVTLAAPTPVGVLRGIETLLQLVTADAAGYGIPAVTIRDRPRFPWRGLLIDACRHWIPPEVILRNLDAMAAVKLNVLHWHLSEDQGFRVESTRYPKLHREGSDGDFYSTADVRRIVAHARERGIRIVPEFDVPGHTTAWLVGHPELASLPGPYAIKRVFGVHDPCMDPTREETYRFLDAFVGEMAALFPDPYFHVGGDEVNGKHWNASPEIAAFKRARGMKTNDDLQAHFNARLLKIVEKHGKRLAGWDEILHPDLPRSSLIQSWRGQDSLARAARDGYSGILSFGWYLDHLRTAAEHYRVEPLDRDAARLGPGEAARILGGEACMWSELVTAENIDSRIWPRAAAIAERLWSPRAVADVDDMYRRLERVARDLDGLGVRHRSGPRAMLERLAGDRPVEPLAALAAVLAPGGLGERNRGHRYTTYAPMNRLVDATPAESDLARDFAALVERVLAAPRDGEARAAARGHLAAWRDLRAELAPYVEGSFLLAEAAPLARDLAAVAAAGLAALDALGSGRKLPAAWRAEQAKLLDAAARPRAELRIMVVPAVRRLVERAAGGGARP